MKQPANLLYLQSGGPTSVINASLFGVIKERERHRGWLPHLYGALHGVEGLIGDKLIDLGKEDPREIALLPQTPGAILGSTRERLPGEGDPLFAKIVATVRKHGIGYILVNGGNDSMDTCSRLASFFGKAGMGVKVLGIPKTVDNDLMATDHSIGYPSAAKHVMNVFKMIALDAKAYTKGKLMVIEVMGRDTGWLTAAADLLPDGERPDLIYVPEAAFSPDRFLREAKAVYDRKGYGVAAVSEGLPLEHLNAAFADSFGHRPLEGVCYSLAASFAGAFHIGTRTMELSIPERADPLTMSLVDQKEAIAIGAFAVRSLLKGATGQMACLERISSNPYKARFALAPAEAVANQEKKIPAEWLADSSRLTDEFRSYLRPLVSGEPEIRFADGVFSSSRFRYLPPDD